MKLEEFMRLFRGLDDGYGEEVKGRIKNRKNPVTKAIFKHHVLGSRKIGIYPLRRDNTVFFACLDFDGEESERKAKLIYGEALKLKLEPIPEISSSGEGRHLWFFFKDKVPAWKARRLLASLVSLAELDKDTKIEIFPKQDYLGSTGWGNFVFLPMQGKLAKEDKTIFLNWEGSIDFENCRITKDDLSQLVPERLNPKRKQLGLGRKTALEILDIFEIELKGMEVKGDEIWALCPFHKETEASFSINNKELLYYCFGCAARGYIDELVEHLTGETFTELAKKERIEKTDEAIYSNRDGDRVEIADFSFGFNQLYRTEDSEIIREMIFSQNGSKLKALAPGQSIGTRTNFRNYCLTQGPYHFKGTDNELQKLIKEEDDLAVSRNGICTSHTNFGFRNLTSFDTTQFIRRGKKIYYPDDDNIFRAKTEIIKMEIAEDIVSFAPFSKTPSRLIEDQIKPKKNLLKAFQAVYPEKPVEIVLGWIFASIYSPEIREEFDMFPILFLVGPNSTGKTCLARNLLGLWGMEAVLTIGKGSSYTGVKRALESALGTPVCVDDYRNVWAMQEKDDLLRSSFDSIPGFKGTREGRKVYSELATATVIGTGEELPQDTGLRARLIPFRLEVIDHPDIPAFTELEKSILEYSPILIEEIRKKSSKNWEKLKNKIDILSELFFELLHHSRQSRIWAIPIASYYHFFGEEPSFEKIKKFVSSAKEEKQIREEEDLVSDFLITLDSLVLKEFILEEGLHYIVEDDKLYLKLKPCYRLWAEGLRRSGDEPFKYGRLRTELEGKSYIEDLNCLLEYRGVRQRYVKIDLLTIPQELIPTFLVRAQKPSTKDE